VNARIICHRLAPALRAQIDAQALKGVYETIDLPVAGVLANIERAGIRVDPKALDTMSVAMKRKSGGWRRKSGNWPEWNSNVNSPTQLAEILFDKLNLQAPMRRGRDECVLPPWIFWRISGTTPAAR